MPLATSGGRGKALGFLLLLRLEMLVPRYFFPLVQIDLLSVPTGRYALTVYPLGPTTVLAGA